ncbi:hypothetical protein BH20VER1_BH20VER1_01790 [soil metagenome]
MKRHIFPRALLALAFSSALLLASCSTTQTRISERPEVFNSLSPTDQALVQQGRIREGMRQDAVYIAWGAPNQRGPGRFRGRATETWIYFSTTAADYYPPPFAYGYGYGIRGGFGLRGRYGRLGYGRGLHRYAYYDPFYDPWFYRRMSVIAYPERAVSFQNGRVISYVLLPEPRVF